MLSGRWQIGKLEALAYAGLGFAMAMLFSAKQVGPVLAGALINPDSYMRLARLKETLRQGSPVHEVMRDGSGIGSVVHWSHLIDSLLCVLALPFLPFTDADAALHFAAALSGPLGIAALAVALAWAVAPFADRAWLWLGPFAVGLTPVLLPYGLFGVAHHHVAAVVVAVMTAGWAARAIGGHAPRHGGVAMGAWVGLGVWLTPETVPHSIMALAAIWVVWVTRSSSRYLARFFADAGATMFVVIVLAWAVNPPLGGLTSEDLDRVSVIFVVLAGAIAMTGIGLRVLDRLARDPWRRGWTSALCGALFALDWVGLYPVVVLSPVAAMTDESTRAMFADIIEMRRVAGVDDWVRQLLTGSLGTAALVALAWRARSIAVAYAALCALAMLALGYTHIRFAAYPQAFGAAMLPVILTAVSIVARGWPAWRQPLPRLAAITGFVLVPLSANLIPPLNAAPPNQATRGEVCPVDHLGGMLAPYAGAVVLTDVNNAPALQYRSEIVTVGSLYHRNPAGFLRLRDAWRTDAAEMPPLAFAVARIAYVLHCPEAGRSALVKDLPTTTLLDRLNRGEVPGWLTEAARDPESGHVLYRVGS